MPSNSLHSFIYSHHLPHFSYTYPLLPTREVIYTCSLTLPSALSPLLTPSPTACSFCPTSLIPPSIIHLSIPPQLPFDPGRCIKYYLFETNRLLRFPKAKTKKTPPQPPTNNTFLSFFLSFLPYRPAFPSRERESTAASKPCLRKYCHPCCSPWVRSHILFA